MEHACAQDMLFFYTFVKNQLYKMTTTENIRKELQDLVDSKYQEFCPGSRNREYSWCTYSATTNIG